MVGERLKWRKALSALMGATVLLFGIPAITVSAAGVDDYPYRGHANMLDPWGFYTGYCTSFVAFRLTQEGVSFHGASLRGPNGKTAFFGNGGTWDSAAAAIGYAVNSTPTVGSVAVWHGGEGGAWSGGHVAYVMAVDGAGNATVEGYNWSNYLRYGQRTTRAPRYIHFVGVRFRCRPRERRRSPRAMRTGRPTSCASAAAPEPGMARARFCRPARGS